VIITTGRIQKTFTRKINLHGSQQLNSEEDSNSCCAQRTRIEVTDFQFEAIAVFHRIEVNLCSCLHNRTGQDQHRSRDGHAEWSSISKNIKSIYCEYYNQLARSAARLLGSKSRQNQTPARNQV
jgi:hypothetical protein